MNARADQDGMLLAVQYLRKQVRNARNQWDGAGVGEDIECIHDVRVASRRLRVALRLLRPCLSRKKFRRWRRGVRRLTRGLSEARDKDVKIAFVRTFLDSLADRRARPGVARLLLRLEQDRCGQDAVVRATLKRVADSGVLDEMRTFAKAALAEAGEVGPGPAPAATRRWCGERIAACLAKMRKWEAHLGSAQHTEAHHKMRIAAKRLRYTMEIVAPAYGEMLLGGVAVVKHVQSLLGDIHECDVWQEFLAEFREAEYQRTQEYFGRDRYFARLEPGIACLRENRLARRRELFGHLHDFWQELTSRGYWPALADVAAGGTEPLPPAESILPASAEDTSAPARPAGDGPAGDVPA